MRHRQFIAAATSVTFIPGAQTNPYQDADYIRTLATRLSTGLYEHGGIPILPSVLRHSQRLQSAVTSTDRALQVAASDTVTWAAWVANDTGRYDVADHLGRLALVLGERAGDQNAQAAAYSVLTDTNIARKHLDRAVMYAKRGLALQGINSERRAWLNMRLGRALAQVDGQEYAAREALAHAQSFVVDLQNMVDVADMTGVIGEVLSDLHAFD